MLRVTRTLVLGLALVVTAACSAPAGRGPFDHPRDLSIKDADGQRDPDVDEGRTLLEKGDYDGALAALLRARKRSPDAPAVNYLLAEAHQAMGQCLKASAHLVRAGTEGEIGEWARVMAGRWARGIGDGSLRCAPRRKAAAAVSNLLELSPELGDGDLPAQLATLLTERATELQETGRCKDALILAKRAEDLTGEGRALILLKGRCYMRRGQHEKVVALAEACLERAEPSERVVAALARHGEETYRHETSISLWSLLRNSKDLADEATSSLGRLQLKVKRAEESVKSWRVYVSRGADPAARLQRAVEAAQQLGEFDRVDDAIAILDEGLRDRPGDLAGVRLRARLLWRSDRRQDALESLRGWMTRQQDTVSALETVLELLSDWEGWTEGLKLLYQVRSEAGGNLPEDMAATGWLYTGLFRTRLGDTTEARKAFDAFLSSQGNKGRARARIGELLLHGGEPSLALPWLEAAVKQSPRWPAATPSLASALHGLDRGEGIPELFDDFVAGAEDKGVALGEVARWWAGVGKVDAALAANGRALALLATPGPEVRLLQARLLLTQEAGADEAWPHLEAAARKIDPIHLSEIWRLAADGSERQAACVRAAVLARPEARIGVASDGGRALKLPGVGREDTIPLSLDAELTDLLGCGRGSVEARIDGYLAEAEDPEAAVGLATTLVIALLDASYPDRVAGLLERFPQIPPQSPKIELRLVGILLPRDEKAALQRLKNLSAQPGMSSAARLEGAESFLALNAPAAAEIIIGRDLDDFDGSGLCRALRITIETHLAMDRAAEAMDLGQDLAKDCIGSPGEVVSALDRLADSGPPRRSFELSLSLLDRLHEPTHVRRIVLAAVRAGRRSGMGLDEVGDALARASKGWKGETEVAGVLAATGRFSASSSLLDAARERNPGEGETLKRILMLHRLASLSGVEETHSRDAVLDMCRQHLMANERSEESVLALLSFLEGLGFMDLAVVLADEYITDTSNPGVLLLRASLALETPGDTPVLGLLERGVMSASDTKSFLDAATGLLDRYGHSAEAISLLESAARIRSDLPVVAMGLAARLSRVPAPDWQRIAGLIDAAVARVPALVEKGTMILVVGDRFELARPILMKVLDGADPGASWAALRLLLGYAAESGSHKEVMELVDSFVAKKQPGFRIQSVGDLLFEYGYLDHGLALLEKHQGKDPNQAANVLRALKLIQAGRVDEGLALVEIFFEELVLAHHKLTRSDVMAPELHKLFDSVNDFLWDMGLDAQAGAQLDRAIETYPSDAVLLEARCRRLLATPGSNTGEIMALFRRLLEVDSDPASLRARSLVHHLSSRGLGGAAADLMQDALDAGHPGWWTPMLLELLVTLDRDHTLRRVVEQLAARPQAGPELLASCGATLLGRGQTELAELLIRQGLLRLRGDHSGASGEHKSKIFSQLDDAPAPGPDVQLSGRLMVLLVRALAAGGAEGADIHGAARVALRLQVNAQGVISKEARRLLASALDEMEIWDAALTEWRLQQAMGEGGAAPYLREFRIHLIRGDEAAARETLWRCVATTPGTIGLLTRFADQARRLLALEIANELYDLALKIDGGNRALCFAAAEPLLLAGNVARARELLETYAGNADEQTYPRVEAAALAYRYNRFALAETLLGTLSNATASLERAKNLVRAGDTDKAWSGFEAGTADSRDQVLAGRAFLGALLQGRPPLPALIENLLSRSQVPKVEPAVTRYWSGVLLLKRGRWAQAVRTFEAGLRGTRARFALGMSMIKELLRHGRTIEAEALAGHAFAGFKLSAVQTELAKAVAELLHGGEIQPKHVAAVADLGVRVAEAALASDPSDTWVMTQLAEVQFAAGRVDAAVKLYDEAMDALPGDSGLENNQAYLLALTGRQTERAVALVNAAIRREPSHNVFYLDTLGWLQRTQGHLEDAERNIKAALVRADFSSPGGLSEALYHLGMVQLDLGRKEDARDALNMASVNDPYGPYGDRARKKLQELGVDPYHR